MSIFICADCGQTLFRIFLIFVFICGHKQTNRQKRFRLDCVKKSHSATFGCLAAISRAVAITKKKASGLQKDYKKSVGIIIRNRKHNWLPDFQLESTTFLPGIQVESATFFSGILESRNLSRIRHFFSGIPETRNPGILVELVESLPLFFLES